MNGNGTNDDDPRITNNRGERVEGSWRRAKGTARAELGLGDGSFHVGLRLDSGSPGTRLSDMVLLIYCFLICLHPSRLSSLLIV